MARLLLPLGSSSAGPNIGYRLLLSAILLGLAWLSLAGTVDQVLGKSFPQVAARWAPWGANWQTQVASVILEPAATGGDTRAVPASDVGRAATLARNALDRSPVRAAPARLIGLATLLSTKGLPEQRSAQARVAFEYANRVSRRDLPTQMYLIEQRVSMSDIAGALTHYDVAMRTSPASRALLGNVLIDASAESDVAQGLARLLATRPSWLPEFYQRFTARATNGRSIVTVANALHFKASRPEDAQFISMALSRLIQLGAVQEARDYYREVVAAATDGLAVRNGGFEAPNRFAPFDWSIASEPGYSGIIERRSDAPGTVLTLGGSESGEIAHQLLVLHPGRYQMSFVSANIPQAMEERPKVTLKCLSGTYIMSVPFSAASDRSRKTSATFSVPESGCNAQWLGIQNAASFDSPPSLPWIDSITITGGVS